MLDIKKVLQKYPQICFQKKWQISDETLYQLGQCDAFVTALKGLPLSPAIRDELLRVAFVKGALATTAIEGNTLSEEEVRLIQEKKSKILPSRKYLETEVKNVLDALNEVLNEVVYQGIAAPVTPDLIKNFHRFIGKDLGEQFESIPGQFRTNNVIVGTYRPPDHSAVSELVVRMCEWLQREFGFSDTAQVSFKDGVIEAIVAHVYLVWIHPFSDGNGRTARLLEFYLLLRCGLPNICSHILSNHYNNTRSEYYRQLSHAGEQCDLSNFISYAVQGLLDGLTETLHKAQNYQMKASWINYIHDQLDAVNILKPVRKRCKILLTGLKMYQRYTLAEMAVASPNIISAYAKLKPGALNRDVKRLVDFQLLSKDEEERYMLNPLPLLSSLPKSR